MVRAILPAKDGLESLYIQRAPRPVQQFFIDFIHRGAAPKQQVPAVMCPRALCARSDSEASVAWTLGFGRPHNEVTHSASGERIVPSANRRKEVLYAGTLLRPIADR